MARAIDELKSLTREYQLLTESSAILAWDQETYIPPKAVPERGEQLALLNSLAHQRLTSPRVGELLEQCGCTDEHPDGTIETSELDHAYLRELYRRYTREIRLPSSLVEELSRAASAGQAAWATARGNDDFDLFQPHLERLVTLTIEKAQAVGYSNHPYDALLNEYEPWTSTAEIVEIFDSMETSLRSLIERIDRKPQVDDSFLHQSFPLDDQRTFAARVLDDLGYDRTRSRIDETAHPFTTTLGAHDVRITGRFRSEYLGTGLFGLIHEFGHALYELGFAEEIQGNILASGTSLGIHESQSRTWENVVARSVPFWERFLPVAKEFFPSQLSGVTLEQFTKAINKVSAGPIRIDADEVSYGMHIILRFRIERELIEGILKPADVPEAWQELSRKLLGIVPRSNAEGALQDIHWSMGGIGYFPTYALGNLYGAQMYAIMEKELPNLDQAVRGGDFFPLREWLNQNIHRHGASKSAGELCREISGEGLDSRFFLDYLEKKYSRVYALS